MIGDLGLGQALAHGQEGELGPIGADSAQTVLLLTCVGKFGLRDLAGDHVGGFVDLPLGVGPALLGDGQVEGIRLGLTEAVTGAGGHALLGPVAELLEYGLDVRATDQVAGDPGGVARAIAGVERCLAVAAVLHDALDEQALARAKPEESEREGGARALVGI